MIPNEEIGRLAHTPEGVMVPAEWVHRLLAERELLVAEHRATNAIRLDPDYDYLSWTDHDKAWQTVEDFK